MQSVFVRHNCSSTAHILQQLWERRLVALHYNDDYSTDPSDYYPAGRKALERLWNYSKDGAIVGADYRRFDGSKMLVGFLERGSRVFAEEFRDPHSGESFVYKLAALSKAVEVKYADYPLLVGVQPRQATITGWPSAGGVLLAALHGQSLPRKPNSLHPSQLEVLCYEWLRNSGQLERLVLPIGRGLIDIDILGTNRAGKRIIAQVTYSKNAADLADKQSRLLRHARDSDTVYFFLPEKAPLEPHPSVKVVPVERVLKDLEDNSDASTQAMLREMFAEYS